MLRAMGIDEEKIEQIIEAHTETMEALKTKADTYEEDAKKLESVQKELDDLKKNGGDWEKKYNDEHHAFEQYKAEITNKQTKEAKEKAYRSLLSDLKVSDKRHDAILKLTDLNSLEIDQDGKIKDEKTLREQIAADYADFIVTTEEKGTPAANPPGGKGSNVLSMDDIYAMENGHYKYSAAERQAALAKLEAERN
jgi:hypothetical protein